MSTLESDDLFDIDPAAVPLWEQRLRRWLWPIVGFTAWVVFELTSELWASTLILCAHYAWNPFTTGCWLWWNDPWRQRGRCSLLAFCGHAVGRMVLAGFVITIFLSPLSFRNAAIEKAVMAAVFVYLFGIALMVMFVWLALFLARISNVRLWVNGQVRRTTQGHWPPTQTGHRNRIKAGFWLSSLLGVPAIALAIGLPLLLNGRIANPANEALVTLLLLFGSLAVVFVFYYSVASSAIGYHPKDCWPELADDTAADAMQFSGWN